MSGGGGGSSAVDKVILETGENGVATPERCENEEEEESVGVDDVWMMTVGL